MMMERQRGNRGEIGKYMKDKIEQRNRNGREELKMKEKEERGRNKKQILEDGRKMKDEIEQRNRNSREE